MPTTANGTVYTVYTATIDGLGRVRYIVADNAKTRTNLPCILYAHGANGGLGSFSGGAGSALLRDWLMDHGWVLIEGEGGPYDSTGASFNWWGAPISRQAYRAYFLYVAQLLSIGIVVAMGASMGGLVTKWLATRSDIASRIVGYLGLAAVATLFYGNYDTVPTDNPNNINQRSGRYFAAPPNYSIWSAYGVNNYEDFEVAAASSAPELWEPSVWANKRILEVYADNDIAVPWNPRGASRLRELRAGVPLVDIAHSIGTFTTGPDGVGHDLAAGWGMPMDVVTEFLTSLIPPVDPDPGPTEAFYATSGYFVNDGTRYPIVVG
jgi:hypothetical protein